MDYYGFLWISMSFALFGLVSARRFAAKLCQKMRKKSCEILAKDGPERPSGSPVCGPKKIPPRAPPGPPPESPNGGGPGPPPGPPPESPKLRFHLGEMPMSEKFVVRERRKKVRKKEKERKTRRQNQTPFQSTRTGAEMYSRERKPLTPI